MIVKLSWPDGYECWVDGRRGPTLWEDNRPDAPVDPRFEAVLARVVHQAEEHHDRYAATQRFARAAAAELGAVATVYALPAIERGAVP